MAPATTMHALLHEVTVSWTGFELRFMTGGPGHNPTFPGLMTVEAGHNPKTFPVTSDLSGLMTGIEPFSGLDRDFWGSFGSVTLWVVDARASHETSFRRSSVINLFGVSGGEGDVNFSRVRQLYTPRV